MSRIHPLSRDAFLSLPEGYLSAVKQDLLCELAVYGIRTCERICHDYNWRRSHHGLKQISTNTLRPRIIELKDEGIIIEDGVTITPGHRKAALLNINPDWRQRIPC